MNSIICIAGPTASGKTALAVELAKALNGEVVPLPRVSHLGVPRYHKE